MSKYLVIVEKGKQNCSAYSPDMPGCVATGHSLEDTLAEMESAMRFHLEGMIEDGDFIPEPLPVEKHLDEIKESQGMPYIWTQIELAVPEVA